MNWSWNSTCRYFFACTCLPLIFDFFAKFLQLPEDKHCPQVIWIVCYEKARGYSVRLTVCWFLALYFGCLALHSGRQITYWYLCVRLSLDVALRLCLAAFINAKQRSWWLFPTILTLTDAMFVQCPGAFLWQFHFNLCMCNNNNNNKLIITVNESGWTVMWIYGWQR